MTEPTLEASSSNADFFDPQLSPVRSQTTDSVPRILSTCGVSLFVSTYQAGYVVAVRATSVTELNTHFRRFPRPMGMAYRDGRLAIGTNREIVEFFNMPAVTEKIESPVRADAVYLPRKSHFTGEIDIHELAWGSSGVGGQGPGVNHQETGNRGQATERTNTSVTSVGSDSLSPDSCPQSPVPCLLSPELWFINTRFSALCTLDAEHNFVPRWWPKFITGLSPDDRCHLNGVALRDGRPAFVTCHSASDGSAAWREHKKDGGIVIDVATGETVVSGLAMPHSPRWRDGRLFVLESGDGSLGTVDLATGRYEAITRFDGFTRGLSFHGDFAFVGLSQIRESAIFSGIPIATRLQDQQRLCGVAIVQLSTGQQVGWVHFQDAVQEVFAVEVVPHRYPDILEPSDPLVGSSYSLPDDALQFVSSARSVAATQ